MENTIVVIISSFFKFGIPFIALVCYIVTIRI